MLKLSNILPIFIILLGFQTSCKTIELDILDDNTFKIIRANDYKLPVGQEGISAKFKENKIYLNGTCNPTVGEYSVEHGFITLDRIGHLGQNAYTELIKGPDGKVIREIIDRSARTRTEEEFIELGRDKFRIESSNGRIHFISDAGKVILVLQKT